MPPPHTSVTPAASSGPQSDPKSLASTAAKTSNIVCEKPTQADWVAMGHIYNQSVRNKTIPQLNPMTDEQSMGYFARCENGNVPTIVARLNGVVVGWLMVHSLVWGGISTSTTADLCIYVDADHAGKLSGVALRMLSTGMRAIVLAGFERVTIWTYAENKASQDMAAAMGMTRWGYLPSVAKMDENLYKDVTIWGVEINDTWLQRWERLMKRLARKPYDPAASALAGPQSGRLPDPLETSAHG